ncbi:hypothetical protein SBV1_1460010 [Verrucomicrobia bacterium]|nr:hypothetical protein SBV1_1460010 [Verrucomicrobiota bacterium]
MASISAGAYHSLAVGTDGTCWSRGYNVDGELGNGHSYLPVGYCIPGQVLGLSQAIRASGGGSHSVSAQLGWTVESWGSNNYGQLGDGTRIERNQPVSVYGGFILSY